jgi:dihydrodipicolinate synthase/N-acetylneuraminate lyase
MGPERSRFPSGFPSGLPRGLICPLVTPLRTGDLLDRAHLDRLIAHVGKGADALLLGDLIWGEGRGLSVKTRSEMVVATLEIAQGRWPVLVTITSSTGKATQELLSAVDHFVSRSGYAGSLLWVDYPMYYRSNRGLPQWYEHLAQATEIGFVLGNNPLLVGKRRRRVAHTNIRTSVLKKTSQVPAVCGLVFNGALERLMNYYRAVRHRRDFRFYDGDEMAFIEQPSSNGVVAGGANLLPRIWRDVTWSCLNRYDVHQQYPDHRAQIVEAGRMLQEFQALYAGNPAAFLKRMLHVAGVLPNAHTASTTRPTTKEENMSVEAICRKYDLI